MANVVNKTTMQLVLSANTPDYPSADWLHDPASLGSLIAANVPSRYWKLSGDDIAEMSQSEKDAVDSALAAEQLTADRESALSSYDTRRDYAILIRAVVLEVLGQINANSGKYNDLLTWLSTQAQLTQRAQLSGFVASQPTASQARTAILQRVDAGEVD